MEYKNTGHEKVSIKEKVSFGLADGFGMLLNLIIANYLVYFYTNAVGISLVTAGTITLIARIWDGINDPIMGIIVDKTKTKYGKARPYLLWFAIPFALISVSLFLVPDISTQGKTGYALFTYLLYTTVFTAVYLPYGALGALMSNDQKERSSLQTYRMVTYSITALSMGFIPSMADFFGGGNIKLGYVITISIYAVLSAIGFLLAFKNCEERVHTGETVEKVPFKVSLKNLYLNRPWITLALYQLLHWIKVGIIGTSTMYYLLYFMGVSEFQIGIYSMIPSLVGLVSTAYAGKIEQFFKGKRNALMALNMLMLIGYFGSIAAGTNYTMALCFTCISYLFMSPSLVYMYASIADTVEYGEWKTGVRAEGIIFAGQSFTSKVGPGLGTSICTLLLAGIGFNPEAPVAAAVNSIPALVFGAAAFISVVQVCILKFYNLTDKKYNEIVKELQTRKGQ